MELAVVILVATAGATHVVGNGLVFKVSVPLNECVTVQTWIWIIIITIIITMQQHPRRPGGYGGLGRPPGPGEEKAIRVNWLD